jgi:DNA primase
MTEFAGFDLKEQVRQATDIVELVGGYLSLRREGRNFKALCPWHDDSKPSLQVNPQRQSFKCWVCNIGGDVFSFIMKMEHVEFPEAMQMLADRAGIKLTKQQLKSGDDKQLWFKVLAWAEERFHQYLLQSPEAEIARRYFDDRGITEESLGRFKLGFSPDSWDWLLKQALAQGFNEELLEKVGLAKSRGEDKQGAYDMFRGRVLFPIRDVQSRTVGFGGRVLPQFANTTPAKYINSPETPLFSKHKLLYGLDSARDAMSKSKTVLVMEGYTDCIMARQFGFQNSVAVLGTALGEAHLKVLRQYVDRVVLVLDGDEAGQKRTNEILELFINDPMDLRVMTLPDDLDPCDLLIERGKHVFHELLDSAVDAVEHVFQVTAGKLTSSSSPHDLTRAMEKMLSLLAKVPLPSQGASTEQVLRESLIISRMSRKFDMAEQVLRDRLRDLRRQNAAKVRQPFVSSNVETTVTASSYEPVSSWPAREQELMELILLEPEAVGALIEELPSAEIKCSAAYALYKLAAVLNSQNRTPDFATLMNALEDENLKNILIDLDERAQSASWSLSPAERLRLFIEALQRDRVSQAQKQRERMLRDDAQHEQDKLDVLMQLVEQERLKRGISTSTDGR